MTAGAVLTLARRALNDAEVGNYRWPTADLLRYLNDGQRYLRKHRADLFLASGAMAAITDATAVGDSIVIDEDFKETLADYIIATALNEDSSDTLNAQRAGFYLGRFNETAGIT